jgi:hypothetical protein
MREKQALIRERDAKHRSGQHAMSVPSSSGAFFQVHNTLTAENAEKIF